MRVCVRARCGLRVIEIPQLSCVITRKSSVAGEGAESVGAAAVCDKVLCLDREGGSGDPWEEAEEKFSPSFRVWVERKS